MNGNFSRMALLKLVLVCCLVSQTSTVPYAPFNGATFTNEQVNQLYKGSYSSIRRVDFRNLTFGESEPGAPLSLKDGSYRRDEPNDHAEMELGSVYYLQGKQSSEARSALVLLFWSAVGGSSSQGYTAQVFTLKNSRLRMTQTMTWDTHLWTKEPMQSFDPSTSTLVVRTAHYIPGDAHCCVSATDVITLRWDGTRFAQKDFKAELSDYGKEEGKRLG